MKSKSKSKIAWGTMMFLGSVIAAVAFTRAQSPRGAVTFFTRSVARAETVALMIWNFWAQPLTTPDEQTWTDETRGLYREDLRAECTDCVSEAWGIGAPMMAGFEFNTETGKVYHVEMLSLDAAEDGAAEDGAARPSLPSWAVVSPAIVGTGSNVSFAHGAPAAAAIYRVRCEP